MILETKILLILAGLLAAKQTLAHVKAASPAAPAQHVGALGSTTLPQNLQSPSSYVGGGTLSQRVAAGTGSLGGEGPTVDPSNNPGASVSFGGDFGGFGKAIALGGITGGLLGALRGAGSYVAGNAVFGSTATTGNPTTSETIGSVNSINSVTDPSQRGGQAQSVDVSDVNSNTTASTQSGTATDPVGTATGDPAGAVGGVSVSGGGGNDAYGID